MTEALEGIDATVGFRAGMTWTERLRLGIRKLQGAARRASARPSPSIAYSGEGTPAIWKVLEDFLAILLDAFERREAIVQIRMLSGLPRRIPAAPPAGAPPPLDPHQIDLMRRGLRSPS